VETVGLGCGLRKAKIAVGLGEVDFEGGPGFLYCWQFAPIEDIELVNHVVINL
jgi:hypothetical protein